MTTPDISLTLFKSIFDNKTNKRIDLKNFDQFENLLLKLSKEHRKGKRDAYLISPATYIEGQTRANRNVLSWGGWAAVDVDDYIPVKNLKEDLNERFGKYRFICYSTASSTRDHPKFRVVFKLTQHVDNERIKFFWYALNREIGELGDIQTKDMSRMYYIPALYSDAYNFFFSSRDGVSIDPEELIKKHPYARKANLTFLEKLPESMRKEVLNHRKSKLTNTDVTWTNYRDCPFFPKNLASEYMTISTTGWYHKMYQIMVAIAGNATKNEYPITSQEIAHMCRQLDQETGNWYENRPLEQEADRALEYVYSNM